MHISPRMYSSDGSLEGMSGVDERGEPPSLSPKQGQGKSSKQDKVDFFARLLEGLVKNSPTGRGLTLSVLGEGPQPEAAQAGGEPQGNASKKNQHKKARVSGGDRRAGRLRRC